MKLKKLICAILSIALVVMTFPSSISVSADDGIDLNADSITYLTSYITWDGEDETTKEAVVKIVDTTNTTAKKLEEGLDFTSEFTNVGTETSPVYEITITGIGDYTGTRSIETTIEGTIYEKGNVQFISLTANFFDDWGDEEWTDEGDEYEYTECYVTAFGVTNPNVTSASIKDYYSIGVDDYDIYGILPGSFMNLPSLKTAKLGDLDFQPHLFVNCPVLDSVTVECEEAGYALDTPNPLPMIIGDKGIISITASEDFTWLDENDEEVYTIKNFCDLYGYKLITTSDTYQTKEWDYKIDTDYESAMIIRYKGDSANVTIPDTVEYNGETYDIDDIDRGTFVNLDTLETIDMGNLYPVNNMCSNCPNLKTIIVRATDPWDLDYNQPIVTTDSTVTIRAFPGVIASFIDSAIDETLLINCKVEEYCEKWGYNFKAFEIDEIDFEILNNYSKAVIAGGTTPLAVTISTNKIEEERVLANEIYSDIKYSDWSAYGDGAKYVTLNKDDQTITTKADVEKKTSFTISCKISMDNEDASDGTYTRLIEQEFILYPRITVKTTYAYPGLDDVLPFTYYEYENYDVYTGEIDPDSIYEPEEGEFTLFEEVFVDDTNDASTMSLINNDVLTCSYEIIEGNASVVDNTYLVLGENAKEGDKINLKATFNYRGEEFVRNVNIDVVEGAKLDDSTLETLEDLDEEGGTLTILCWKDSAAYKLIDSFIGTYPQLAPYIACNAIDEDEPLDTGNPKEFYKEYKDLVASEMSEDQDNCADIVIWPSYMAGEEMGSIVSASMGSVSSVLAKYPTLINSSLQYVENDKVYGLPLTTDQGAFLYRKDVAKKLFGTDNPKEVQKHLINWDEFVQVAYDIKKSQGDAANYKLVSSLDGLSDAVINGTGLAEASSDAIKLDTTVKTYYSLERKLKQMDMVGDEENSLGRFITLNGNENIDESVYGVCQGPYSFEGNSGEVLTITKAHTNDAYADLRDFIVNALFNGDGQGKFEKICSTKYGDLSKRVNNTEWQTSLWKNIAKDQNDTGLKDMISISIQNELANNYPIEKWMELTEKDDLESLELADIFDEFNSSYITKTTFPEIGVGIPNLWEDDAIPAFKNITYTGDWVDTGWEFEAEDVDKSELEALIKDAQKLIENVKVSNDGTDILDTMTWVTKSVYDNVTSSIATAKEAVRKYNTTLETVNSETEKMTKACKAFVPKKGLKLSVDETLTDEVADKAPVDSSVKAVSGIKLSADFKKKTLKVSFSDVSGAQTYLVLYKKNSASTWTKVWTTTPSKTISKMSKNGLYELKIAGFKKVNGKWVRGNYSKTQYIFYAQTSISKVQAKKKSAVVTYKKYKKATGYNISYSRSKKMTSGKTVTVKKYKTTKKTVKKLKAKKTYYFQVRPYKKSKGKTYVGIGSKVKKKKIK